MSARRFLVWLIVTWSAWLPGMAPAGDAPSILVFGDSISAGYGIPAGAGWVDLLHQQLQDAGSTLAVVNASISGETTQGGLIRLPELLQQHHPTLVIIELGANDGLRGYPLDITRANLDAMIDLVQATHARVLLLGMRIPPNYGPRYTEQFHQLFQDLAAARHTDVVPFLLEGVATDAALMQDDGVHPNAKAQPLLLRNALPKGLDYFLAPSH